MNASQSTPSPREAPDTRRKAFEVNLDPSFFGAFAEIGAGQEVARWFFRVGGAAGTVAKTMSAYDMRVSDAIYGPSRRYVSRERLQTMLDHEFRLLVERLDQARGETTRFFAFANTVMAKSYTRRDDSNGWLGIRFQAAPRAEPSEILVHVLMFDKENTQQQEALGVLGVNLVYAAYRYHSRPSDLIDSLVDGLTTDRVEIDLIKCSGPAFGGVDNRILNLQLVERGIANATMFTAGGRVLQASEILYKKPVLVERGRFRPVTLVHRDMLERGLDQFVEDHSIRREETVVLMEMTLRDLTLGVGIDHADFLARADMLCDLGHTVLISNYFEYYRLAAYLFRYSSSPIGIVMGVPSLANLLDEKYYAHLEGGILESFGRMFKGDLRLYVYPSRDPAGGDLIEAGSLAVAPHVRHLHAHLLQNGYLVAIRGYRDDYLKIFSDEVFAKIQSGDSSWEDMVPPEVVRTIRDRRLWAATPEEIDRSQTSVAQHRPIVKER